MIEYSVDVIIPSYKPGHRYQQLLAKLAEQTYPIQRLIVINTGKEFYPADGLQPSNLSLTHIEPREFDHGGTRHRGVTMSDSDLVVFLTQDAVPKDRYLIENFVKAFQEKSVAAVYGRQLASPTDSVLEQITRQFNYPQESRSQTMADLKRLGIKTYFCSNVCAAYRRDIYWKLGGFPTRTIFNEDMIFAASIIKAGYTIRYEASVQVYHSHHYSGLQQFRRNFDLAVSQADNPHIFADVPSEKEGIRLVKKTVSILAEKKQWWRIGELGYISACKYAGYLLGKRYRMLPKRLVRMCSMNQNYWRDTP